jgi:hypothetical protein
MRDERCIARPLDRIIIIRTASSMCVPRELTKRAESRVVISARCFNTTLEYLAHQYSGVRFFSTPILVYQLYLNRNNNHRRAYRLWFTVEVGTFFNIGGSFDRSWRNICVSIHCRLAFFTETINRLDRLLAINTETTGARSPWQRGVFFSALSIRSSSLPHHRARS